MQIIWSLKFAEFLGYSSQEISRITNREIRSIFWQKNIEKKTKTEWNNLNISLPAFPKHPTIKKTKQGTNHIVSYFSGLFQIILIQSYHCCSPPHVHRLSSHWRLSLAMLRWWCCLLLAAVVSLQRQAGILTLALTQTAAHQSLMWAVSTALCAFCGWHF